MTDYAVSDEGAAPTRLLTGQLVLRPLEPRDALAMAQHLSEWDIVKQTSTIPFPYDERSALTWIARVGRRHREGRQYAFAITARESDELIGAIALSLDVDSVSGRTGEIGYWLGLPFWGRGYASEAVAAVTEFGLGTLGLDAIEAVVFKENRNSKRVLERCGYRIARAEVRRYPDRGGRRKVLLYAIRSNEKARKKWFSFAP